MKNLITLLVTILALQANAEGDMYNTPDYRYNCNVRIGNFHTGHGTPREKIVQQLQKMKKNTLNIKWRKQIYFADQSAWYDGIEPLLDFGSISDARLTSPWHVQIDFEIIRSKYSAKDLQRRIDIYLSMATDNDQFVKDYRSIGCTESKYMK